MCIANWASAPRLDGVTRGVGGGTPDAARSRMISNKTFNKVLKGVIAAVPAIPYVDRLKRRRRSSMMLPFVLGGIGVALAGGVAAVMFFSPRTRYRALDVAKNTYGRINTQISQMTGKGEKQPIANGMSTEQGAGYASTGY